MLSTYLVSIAAAVVGLGFLLTAHTTMDYTVAVVLLALAGFSALETRRRQGRDRS